MATNETIPMPTSNGNERIRNLELFTCIWLDQNRNDVDDHRRTECKLRRIINHLIIYDNEQQCEEYIQKSIEEKIVFIVSGTLGHRIIPRIDHLSQLSACYIFCGQIQFHQQWSKHYSKIKGVFDDIDKLIAKLSNDQHHREKIEDNAFISVISHNSQSIDERHAINMWFQLYIEVLLRMYHKLIDRKELIELCRKTCEDNEYELNLIREFEITYKSDDAIRWYTRESCLYRILNRALRYQDFDTLFAFRFFLADIAKAIKFEHDKFIRTNNTQKIFSVYRGQFIGTNELDLMKNNIGEFLSMNSFFSTTLHRSTALDFIRSLSTLNNQQQQRILFEITIDSQLQTKPFANITEKSVYSNEHEVLIMVGALFQIKKLLYDEQNHMWIGELLLADECDYRLKDTFAHMKSKIGEETNLASLGKIFFEMGEYNQVEKCYQHMMNDAQLDLSIAHSGLSKAALGKKNFDQAIEHEREALKIKTSILTKNHRDLGVSYSRLGHIYCQQNEHYQALKYLKKAMKIQEKFLPIDALILAKTYQRIALTSVELDDTKLALHFYQKTLQIKQENLPSIDKSIASTYHHMGRLYQKEKEFHQALNYYQNALDIYRKLLPPKHPNILQIEQDMINLNKQSSSSHL